MKKRNETRVFLLVLITLIFFISAFINGKIVNAYNNKNKTLNNQLKVLENENKKLNFQKIKLDKQYTKIKEKISKLK